MEKVFDIEMLTKNLAQLPARARLIMGAMVCERLVPNYRRFEEASRWQGYSTLRAALDSVWAQIRAERSDAELCKQMLLDCDKLVPNSEDFSTNTVSMAIDAANSVCVLLEAVSDASPEKIAEICAAAIDTIDVYIQLFEFDGCIEIGPEQERAILVHPLSQAELRRQREDYTRLAGFEVIDSQVIDDLRSLSEKRGSNLNQGITS